MNQALLEKVLRCPRLPSLPTIAIEVIELCRQSDINIRQIATTISNDPALTTKILRTVNSSYYGLSQSVSTISHALVILGLNSVKTLALGFSLVGGMKGSSDREELMGFWQRSLYSAVASRTIAKHIGLAQHEEAFLGGLLQDVGVMAMLETLGDEYQTLVQEAAGDHARLRDLEQAQLETDHAEIGGALAEEWRLPPILLTPIRYHETPDQAPEAVRPLVQTVHLGTVAAGVFLAENPAAVQQLFGGLRDEFNVDTAEAEQLLSTISDTTQEMSKLFDIKTDQVRSVEQILAEANETLLQLSLQSQQNANQLEQANKELQEQATRDSLTGAANRGRFNEFMRAQFDKARQHTQPLSIIFFDADRFKSVNDTHGHQAGDRVLVTLSKTVQDLCPSQGLVARYGGEEFAMVLPGYDRRTAAQLAEKVRNAIEAERVDIGEGFMLQVTVSLGVATFDGSRFFARPEQLVDAADKAVYAAKESGRNCVRVFAPRAA
jgi:two-component system cell cycle response regulator